MNQVRMAEKYGELKKGQSYPVLAEGYDWVRLKYRGGSLYVPTIFIDSHNDYDAAAVEKELDAIDERNDRVDDLIEA